jgi:N-acetylglucosaminyldiphosphoundecaprenol N-acetyl-beta-D-mannosaminyltransferase
MTEFPLENFDFFGLPVTALTYESLKIWVLDSIIAKNKRSVYGYSLYSIYAIRKMPEIFMLGRNADIFLTDGRPFFWLCKLFKVPVIDGISIPQFVIEVLKIADENHFSVMLLGATERVNIQAVKNTALEYPNIVNIVGRDGYFNDDNVDKIIENINTVCPDILLVGMSSPKKEKFVFNNIKKINARVIIPCGGMIDVLAGKTKMTPNWLKKIGFAFLFRIIQEPRRLLFDRLKMIGFIFVDFVPRLVINLICGKDSFSIPRQYIKKQLLAN